MKGRTCFPKTNCRKRTNDEFRQKIQLSHHTGTSLLEDIPKFDMIVGFPMDYMHLICLGVVKKLIVNMWVYGKPPHRLLNLAIQQISDLHKSFRHHVPIAFATKPRSLDEVKRWKATEFRLFLLYSGPVVMKSLISEDYYMNFLCLHVAVRILCNREFIQEYIDYAESLLLYFVLNFGELYGKEFISHNIHGLIHICDDVEIYGPLDQYSAFPFENCMQYLKNMVRNPNKPLAQIIRRLSEMENIIHKQKNENMKPLCARPHSNGPIPEGSWTEFEVVNSFSLNIKNESDCDCFCLLKNRKVFRIYNFITKKEKVYIYGKTFLEVDDFSHVHVVHLFFISIV